MTLVLTDVLGRSREFAKCARDSFYFATNYVYTLNQPVSKSMLFPQWPYLEGVLNTIAQPDDFFIDKSRDMCISWTIMVHFLHSMLFKESWSGFAISRKEAEVDDGGDNSTPESLFGRIKYMHNRLPAWMKPEFSFSFLKIKNQETGSYATGESANPDSGRNVACTFKFADEFAFLRHSEQAAINRAMRFGSYQTLLYVTTAKRGTFAERICREGLGFKKIEIPWSLRPDKDEKWYQEQVAKSDAEDIAQELDRSYSASDQALILAKFWDPGDSIFLEAPSLNEFDEFAAGLDYGWLASALEVAARFRNKWYVIFEFYEREKTTAQVAELVEFARRELRHDFPVFTGKDRPDMISELLKRGFPVEGIQIPIGHRLGILINAFRKQRIQISAQARELIREVPVYRRQQVGGFLTEVPDRHQEDHAVDALAYLLVGAEGAETDSWTSDWDDIPFRPPPWISDWSKTDKTHRWIHETYGQTRKHATSP